MKKFCIRIVIFSVGIGLLLSLPAYGALSLSLTPVDGAGRLHFGRSNQNAKEVRLRVNSSEGGQYQLFQRMIEPFTNDRAEILNRSVLLAASDIGSNSIGTLYMQNPEPVGMADQLLYSSNAEGTSDSFLISYQVNPQALTDSGTFLGKILYTVRQIGGNEQSTAILDVFVDSFGELQVTARAVSGGESIELGTTETAKEGDAVHFSIKGNSGSLRVFQEMLVYPVNEQGRQLDPDAVGMDVTSNFGGRHAVDFERGQQVLFETSRLDEEFIVAYRLNQEGKNNRQAGFYQGKVRFLFQQDGMVKKTLDFDLIVDIQPVFKMDITYPPGGVNFDGLLPDSPPQIQEVVVSVESNLQRPYMVSQMVTSPLTNEEGEEFENRYFRVSQEFVESERGKLQYPELTPVPTGKAPLYFSDAQGSPATFRVMYQQRPYTGMEPGHYKTAITYTLGEL